MFQNIEWEDLGKLTFFVALLAAVLGIGIALFAPKNVDYYYISLGQENTSATSCVYAHWTWKTDEKSFCTDDKDRALDFVTRANQSLPKAK